MAHDPQEPLCPMGDWEIVEGYPAPNPCECILIRKVDARARADEREKAAQRVANILVRLPRCANPEPKDIYIQRLWAIDAARGEL